MLVQRCSGRAPGKQQELSQCTRSLAHERARLRCAFQTATGLALLHRHRDIPADISHARRIFNNASRLRVLSRPHPITIYARAEQYNIVRMREHPPFANPRNATGLSLAPIAYPSPSLSLDPSLALGVALRGVY